MTKIFTEAEPLALNADQTEVAIRHIREGYHALSTIMQGVEGQLPLTEELAKNCVAVAEYRLRDLCKALGIETQGSAELDERYAKLRAANMRIRDLEAQLGSSQAPEVTQMGVKRLHEALNTWWDFEGFGHISAVEFGPYGVDVKFSCHLFGGPHPSTSETPVSAREAIAQWYVSLAERGFQLNEDPKEREPQLEDCDQNRQALCDLFSTRMPSSQVHGFQSTGRNGYFALRDVTVFIRNYNDILTLPQPTKAEVQ